MRFVSLIAGNLIRRGMRTALTALGLAIGIAAVVTLTAVAWGFEKSFLDIYEAKGVDLIVVRAGVADRLSSTLDEGLGDAIRRVPGVADVASSLMDAVSFEEVGLVSVLVSGWEPGSILFRGLKVVEGRALRPGDERETMLGRVLAMSLGKRVGDSVDVAGETFHVAGIYESTSLFENGGLIVPLRELQQMMGREGQVTGFVVAGEGDEASRSPATLGKKIESAVSGVAAVPTRDYVERDVIIRLAKSMAWVTSAIALVLGSVGMLNTMAMSVFERTKEIGILRALGWKRRRVLALVLGEAFSLGLIGGVLGLLLGIAGLHSLALAPTARGFISGHLPPLAPGLGFLLAVALSLLGGLYPAWRAARLDPIEALRHE
jgi:putative ABC transport system permease protein